MTAHQGAPPRCVCTACAASHSQSMCWAARLMHHGSSHPVGQVQSRGSRGRRGGGRWGAKCRRPPRSRAAAAPHHGRRCPTPGTAGAGLGWRRLGGLVCTATAMPPHAGKVVEHAASKQGPAGDAHLPSCWRRDQPRLLCSIPQICTPVLTSTKRARAGGRLSRCSATNWDSRGSGAAESSTKSPRRRAASRASRPFCGRLSSASRDWKAAACVEEGWSAVQ